MKSRLQFLKIVTISIFLLIAAIGVSGLVSSGALMAQDGDLPYEGDLPKEFYDDDEYEKREETQPNHEQEEQESAQPEDEDLTADTELLFDRKKEETKSNAAEVEGAKIELNAELIKNVQAALNTKNNAGLTVDGVLGNKTAGAVKKFQQANALEATGVLDKLTLIKLDITK